MRNYTGYIIDYSDGNLSDQKRKWFEGELMHNKELKSNYLLFKQVNEFMRAKVDLDEVISDPELKVVGSYTQQVVTEFKENPSKYKDMKGFVNQSLNETDNDSDLQRKILQTKREAEKNNVNEVTSKWVNDWNSKNHQKDLATESRRSFITASLNNEEEVYSPKKSSWNKSFIIRVAGFAAAAMIATLVIVKTMYPTANPENLYQEYYKPLNAYSSTTRDGSTIADQFTNGVELYKKGQYESAASIFSNLLVKDSNNTSISFFAGITQLHLGNNAQAIALLNDVVNKNEDYKKEAQWYLGLAYLKLGDTKKAIRNFQNLAESKGYYQEQAQDLLNRLK